MNYTNFETLGHLPDSRWSAKLSDRSAIMNTAMTKEQYVHLINEMIKECNDLPLLNLILKLLSKSL